MKSKTIWWIVWIVILIIIGYLIIKSVFYQPIGEDDEQLIGGCAGVAFEYQQECCETWAHENGIVTPACVGEWIIIDNQCGWDCS